jgi:hypothetical protein
LDRRAFLQSYDPRVDDANQTLLTSILGAIFPVCGGINLEYYFSHIDPDRYGCGTKLPHNLAALVGVMNGSASDLQPGLPWQMVEIHEPVRLLVLVQATPASIIQILDRNPNLAEMAYGGWLQLATFDGEQGQIHLLKNRQFEVYHPESDSAPQAENSLAWYNGHRDHLEFARIVGQSGKVSG